MSWLSRLRHHSVDKRVHLASLAEYENYRAKLAAHPLHKKYVEVLESTGALLSIHRSIVKRVESSPAPKP
jgi:hypothetical protein